MKRQNVTELLCVDVDLPTYERVQQAWRLSEKRFATAFNKSPVMMSISSFKDNRYTEINECWLETLGYEREEVIGRTISELEILAGPADITLEDTFCHSKEVRNLELELRKKNGDVITGLMSVEILNFDEELCRLSVIRDITERKRLEMEVARLDRQNLVGEMAAGIGHEIRNPLTTVRGFLQLINDENSFPELKDNFDLMIEELDKANSILVEFLSLAKNKAVNMKHGNLNNVLLALTPLILADAALEKKHIRLELEEVPELLLDEQEIRQLLLNLARNGLEAMGPGSTLTIRTAKSSNEVALAVVDEGRGIDADLLAKVGTPFITTKDDGTGLGLAICYSIAARHNATLEFNTNSHGTTFVVRFKTDTPLDC